MNYIIFDLEWNNSFSRNSEKPINEIVEIGAVKLNENLEIVDSFKQLVTLKLSKKLSSRCKRLTKITNEEMRENGIPFEQAISDFARWSRGKDNIFMSWSNSDLYVLSENLLRFNGSCKADFISNYCDVQKYCMGFLPSEMKQNNNQVSLANCASAFEIDVDIEKLHRALSDCVISAECFKKVFDKNALEGYVNHCDETFFERLLYKPYYLAEPVSELFDINTVECKCPKCKDSKMKLLSVEDTMNKAFRCIYTCKKCNKKYWSFIRAKKTYDDVKVSVRIVEMNKKRAKRVQ